MRWFTGSRTPLLIVLAVICAAAGSVLLLPSVPSEARPSKPVEPGSVRTASTTVRLADARVAGDDVREVHTATPFSLLGVKWTGARPDLVEVRHRTQRGGWSAWTALDPSDDQPDVGKASTTSEPMWTGPSSDAQVRARRAGRPVTGSLELVTVDPGRSATDAQLSGGVRAQAMPGQPAVVTRAQWGADESIMTWPPERASTTKAVTIHHTAGTNDYSCAESAALIRGIYRYHAVTNGWGDIGYNVLVDKCGTIFEGRAGGLHVPTIGAHAGGFNTYTFGISMLGTFTDIAPSDAQFESVSAMAAWKLAGSYRDPLGSTVLVSSGGGTARWPAGTAVTMPTIFGHRDTGFTECPGNVAYAQLDRVRNRVVALAGDWAASPIRAKWLALGGDNAFTGGVFAVESALAPGGRQATFAGGDVQITWSQASGAHWLAGALRQRLADAGGPPVLGFPTSDQAPTAGADGRYVQFGPNKAMIWGPYTGARMVSDPFLAALRAGGDVAGYGLPQTEQLSVPGRNEAYQQFERASIYTNAGSLYTVGGSIRPTWQRLGGHGGQLGLPAAAESRAGSLTHQRFEGGVISCGQSAGRTRCWHSLR